MHPPAESLITLSASIIISCICYAITSNLIPRLSNSFIDRGLKGIDLLKDHQQVSQEAETSTSSKKARTNKPKELPECTGVIGASIYILCLTLFIPVIFFPYISHPSSSWLPNTHVRWDLYNDRATATAPLTTSNGLEFPHHSLSAYLASILSLLFATFLGFMDDVFDIRWRYKLPIPVIASVPLLVVYFAGGGITDIVLPNVPAFRSLFGIPYGGLVHLGPLYYLYMSMLSTFCTNSVNILAGINGVETVQSLIIASSIVINDLLYIPIDLGKYGVWGFGFDRGSNEMVGRHLFSIYFMLPMIGTCLALLKHNWYPAKSFVGDTLCYFSGMAFAVVGILGHFSKTVLLFFIPQVLNFLLSCPQIFKLVPCPRHRVPNLNKRTQLLEPSSTTFTSPPSRLTRLILFVFEKLYLIKVTRSKDETRTPISCTNMTILNTILVIRGPMSERNLTMSIVYIQLFSSSAAFTIRYLGAGLLFDAATRR